MPHLTLRHSNNIKSVEFTDFFYEAHKLLSKILNVKITSCSSTVICHTKYLVGLGESDEIFVHLEVLIKSGKTGDTLQEAAARLLEILNSYLESQAILNKKVSVNLTETTYFCS